MRILFLKRSIRAKIKVCSRVLRYAFPKVRDTSTLQGTCCIRPPATGRGLGGKKLQILTVYVQNIHFKPDSSDSPEFFNEGYSEWRD